MTTNLNTIMANAKISNRSHRHEVMRWTSMTEKQLMTRLNRITKPEKLAAFYAAAKMYGRTALKVACGKKLKALHTKAH